MASKRKILLKLLVLGDSGVGKTSLLLRYVQNKFTINTKSTIGANFLSKEIETDEGLVTCQIWDTAGQERFQGLGTAFYRGADGVIFVFDVTRRKSFEELETWRESFLIQVGQEGSKDFPTVIVANKVDLEEQRAVSKEDLVAYCKQHNFRYFETSAKEGRNVDRAFEAVCDLCVAKLEPVDLLSCTVDLERDPTPAKKNDCGNC
ncbi:GTPase [Balamuthia mandrillaris]